ncbi:MAG: radical SAM protein [Bacteroidales bacterium]|nr:radical SAM protein [Bacteroidales bacterium]
MKLRLIEILSPNALHQRFGIALALPTIMALTPDYVDAEYEEVFLGDSTIKINKDTDLVAMSVLTMNAPYIYSIAQKYREIGKKVVLGGMHVSLLPDEALNYCDAVVVGEAESVWNDVIEDFCEDRLKKIYKADAFIDMKEIPRARLDILKKKNYISVAAVHGSRGCPYKCSFCSVTEFYGNTYRFRPVDHIVNEVKNMIDNGIYENYLSFNDDNIACDKKFAKSLFSELKNLNIKWWGQANITISSDPELLKLMYESGCVYLCIGIESVNAKSLTSIDKSMNKIENYIDFVKKIRDAGMIFQGTFILGLDFDDESIFNSTYEFVEKADIDLPAFNIVTPMPGTKIYRDFENENRIIVRDWSKYNNLSVVYKPKLMSADALTKGCRDLYIASNERIRKGYNTFLERVNCK